METTKAATPYAVELPNGRVAKFKHKIDDLSKEEQLQYVMAKNPELAAMSEESGYMGDMLNYLKGGGADVIESVDDIYGLSTGDMETSAGKYARDLQADVLAQRSPELAAAEARRDAAMKAGNAESGWFGEMAAGFGETITDPRLASTSVARMAPYLLPMGAVARGLKGASSLLGAGTKLQGAVGTGAAIGSNAAMHGGSTGGEAYRRLIALPKDTWDNDPQFQALSDKIGKFKAREQIALQLARNTALQSGLISGVINSLPMARTVERMAAGTSKGLRGGIAGRTIVPAGIEVGTEMAEEGSGQKLSNVAVGEVDPWQDPNEMVGGAMGLAATPAGFLGGAAGALAGRAPAAEADRGTNDVAEGEALAAEALAAEEAAAVAEPVVVAEPTVQEELDAEAAAETGAPAPVAAAAQAPRRLHADDPEPRTPCVRGLELSAGLLPRC